MHPLHLKLAATGMLAICVILIIRQTVGHDSGTGDLQPAVNVRMGEADAGSAVTAAPAQTAQVTKSNAPEPTPATAALHAATHAAQPTGSPASQSNSPPLGIRLADNVKLPAVIIALSDPNRDPEHKLPQPVLDCMQGIVDRFYQDLAASAAGKQPGSSPDPSAPEAATDDNTVVIEPGPAVDKARARANEMYRALFGDEAYNRLTMNSALEVQLPTAAPASGESNH